MTHFLKNVIMKKIEKRTLQVNFIKNGEKK